MTTRHEILTRLEPLVSKETFEVLSDDSSDEQTLQMYYQSRKDYEDIEKLEEIQALNKLEEKNMRILGVASLNNVCICWECGKLLRKSQKKK